MAADHHPHRLEWFDLRRRAQMKLQQAESSSVPPGDWDSLLMRFRKLREALTATAAPADLRREVYEMSADVCAAAGNMAELLKCLQQLVNNIYPALERQHHQKQQQQQQQPCHQQHPRQQEGQQQPVLSAGHTANLAQSSSSSTAATHQQRGSNISHYKSAWSDSSDSGDEGAGDVHKSSSSSSAAQPQQRYPEVAAALLLYFVCIPRQPVIQEVTKQLRAAAKTRPCQQGPLILNPMYRQAVMDTAAALRCNWCRFLGSFYGQPQPPLLVRAVMAQHVERLRVQAVRRVGTAYRMLPSAAFQRWLHLQQKHEQQEQRPIGGGGSSSSSSLSVPKKSPSEPESVAFQRVLGLLQQAAETGSKAASIAAAKCLDEGSLPATLHFRA